MTNASGYDMYQKNKVMTASPAELTLMLYEGAIKFINVAIMGIDQKNIEKAHNNIVKATRIIEEFRKSREFLNSSIILVALTISLRQQE